MQRPHILNPVLKKKKYIFLISSFSNSLHKLVFMQLITKKKLLWLTANYFLYFNIPFKCNYKL